MEVRSMRAIVCGFLSAGLVIACAGAATLPTSGRNNHAKTAITIVPPRLRPSASSAINGRMSAENITSTTQTRCHSVVGLGGRRNSARALISTDRWFSGSGVAYSGKQRLANGMSITAAGTNKATVGGDLRPRGGDFAAPRRTAEHHLGATQPLLVDPSSTSARVRTTHRARQG